MATNNLFEPPPTYADPVVVDKKKNPGDPGQSKFNPIWLKWFLDLAQNLSTLNNTSSSGTGALVRINAPAPTGVWSGSWDIIANTVKVSSVAGYKSSDGSTGFTGTVTTDSLVGKTITIKDGIITNVA